MELNLDYYKKDIFYKRLQEEEKIIKYILQNEEKDYDNIIRNDNSEEVFSCLSELRKNIVYAYDFKENSSVLEIGAHFGEITGALCEKNAKVVSIEFNKISADLIAKRHSNKANLKIFAGSLEDIKLEEKFDYITLFGILEYAQKLFNTKNPALDLIKYCKNLLKPDGKLLIATENKFAMKSYIGDIDECTNITFDSVTGYKSSNKTYKIGKKDLENLLQENELKYKFFYPLPDYKLASLIFTDEYLPSSSKINGYFPYYKDNSSIFYSEVDAYDAIVKTDKKVFPFFANSYFVEASTEEIHDDTRYVSFNNYRKKKYQLMTKIKKDYVEKKAINEQSKQHLQQMIDNVNNLKKENIEILDYEVNGNVRSNYVDVKLASQIVSDNVKNPEEIFKILNKYKETIQKLSTPYSPEMETIVEKYIPNVDKNILQKFTYMENGYWDMILKNCFIINENMVFFDQEWKENNVPIEFLLYRSIVNIEKLRENIEKYEIYEKMGIKEFIPLFEELDNKITQEIIDSEIFAFYQKRYKNPIYENYILQDEKNELQNQILHLNEEKAVMAQNQVKLQEQIDKTNSRIAELTKELEGIYDSRSWKIAKKISGLKKH